MSTRRVPKGPGRRPKSLARRRFMELLAEGWSMRAACKEVGISRSIAHIWKNGTTVRLKDGTVKVVPPPGAVVDEGDLAQIPVRGRAGSDR